MSDSPRKIVATFDTNSVKYYKKLYYTIDYKYGVT